MTWTGNQLVAVGIMGTILTSPDGIDWTPRNSGTKLELYFVTWTGDQLIATGMRGTILTSPDGITWTPRNSGTTAYLKSVIRTGKQWVAVGDTVLTSPDGISWTPRKTSESTNLYSMVWTGSQFVAVGLFGAVFTASDDVSAILPRFPSQKLSLQVTPTRLLASLPNSFFDRPARAAIYTMQGSKLVESSWPRIAGEITLPVEGLSRGTYMFKVEGASSLSKPFDK